MIHNWQGAKLLDLSVQKCIKCGMRTEVNTNGKDGRPRGSDEDTALEAATRSITTSVHGTNT
jgi:hypothetical protein